MTHEQAYAQRVLVTAVRVHCERKWTSRGWLMALRIDRVTAQEAAAGAYHLYRRRTDQRIAASA